MLVQLIEFLVQSLELPSAPFTTANFAIGLRGARQHKASVLAFVGFLRHRETRT